MSDSITDDETQETLTPVKTVFSSIQKVESYVFSNISGHRHTFSVPDTAVLWTRCKCVFRNGVGLSRLTWILQSILYESMKEVFLIELCL